MSVSGFCDECGRLITIVPKGTQPGGRQQKWYPVYHPAPGDDSGGPPCPGTQRAL